MTWYVFCTGQQMLTELAKRVRELQKKTMHPQRSPEWFKQRQTKITASEAASCLLKTEEVCKGYTDHFVYTGKFNGKVLNSFKTKEEYVVSKSLEFYGESQFKDNHSTLHGKKYEDIALNLYKRLRGKRVVEFGLLDHETVPWLAASPDGITTDGVMIEIKCPNVRKIKLEEFPVYYWVQMQIQLEVCDLEECDYLECEIIEISEEEWYHVPPEKSSGILLKNGDEYIYPPHTVTDTEENLIWMTLHDPDLDQIFYCINNYQLLTVKRDKEWFEMAKPHLYTVFQEIDAFQKNKGSFDAHYKEFLDKRDKRTYDKIESTMCVLD